MTSNGDAMQRLNGMLEELRTEWYAAGRGDEFEELVSRYRADGAWPFG